MLVREAGGWEKERERERGREEGGVFEWRRKEKHSHLSSNYTTTLIPLGLQLIARVQTPSLLRGRGLGSCLLPPDNNSNHTWPSLSAPEIRPHGLSKVHIELKAEQRGGREGGT